MIRTKGEAGTGDVVHAVKHIRQIVQEMKILTAQSQLGNEVPFCFPTTHIKPDFGQDRLRDHDVDSINPRKIHSGNPAALAAG